MKRIFSAFIFFMMAIGALNAQDDKTADASATHKETSKSAKKEPQKKEENLKLDVKGAKPSVRNVAAQLEELLRPSDYKKRALERLAAPPYIKVIDGPSGRSTLIYKCRFTKANSLVNALESVVSTSGTVEESAEQNMIVINDKKEKMEELKNALLGLDVVTPQILVEAKIVEVLLGSGQQRDVGLTFNRHDKKQNLNSTAGMTTNAATINGGDNFNWYPYIAGEAGDSVYKNLNATIQWLMTANDAKILSAPNLVVSLNATASIVTGQDIPIQTSQVVSGSITTSTDFKRVGVTLNVTPKLVNDNGVTVSVNPQVSNVQRYENITQADTTYKVPVIAVRNIQTELSLSDGQIIMIGGLYSNKETDTEERIPFLSDLPFIGEIFTGKNQSKELTQLIFFLKINILSPEEIADGVIYDPGKQAETIQKVGNVIKNSRQIFPNRDETSVEKLKEEFIDDAVGSKKLREAIDDEEKDNKK